MIGTVVEYLSFAHSSSRRNVLTFASISNDIITRINEEPVDRIATCQMERVIFSVCASFFRKHRD